MNDVALLAQHLGRLPRDEGVAAAGAAPLGLKMASCTTGVSEPEFVPNFQAGQLVGLVGGLAGAAEYEKLIGGPGIGDARNGRAIARATS